MHKTQLEEVKFNLDRIDGYNNTYFLAGWIVSTHRPIAAIRVDADEHYSSELITFDVRHDVNKFYGLPNHSQTGFKLILNPDHPFETLTFKVRFKDETGYTTFYTKSVTTTPQATTAAVSPKPVITPTTTAPQPTAAVTPAIPVKPIPTPSRLPDVGIRSPQPDLIIIDNFYDDPDKVRDYALRLEFNPHSQYHKGSRTEAKTIVDGTKAFFEATLKRKITTWEDQVYNGVFQFCTAQESLVYHTDHQAFAAIVFLTPDAPPECGTSFYRSRHNHLMRHPDAADCKRLGKSVDELCKDMFAGNFYDKTRWDLVDVVGNVYNRMVIFDARRVHAASGYFGDNIENSRLFHMFFFDAE